MNNKALTLKEFTTEVTGFVKAYKKKEVYEPLEVIFELQIGTAFWYVDVERWGEEYTMKEIQSGEKEGELRKVVTKPGVFKLRVFHTKDENDIEGESTTHEIESIGNTTTEIVDFLSYEYDRQFLKKIKTK